MEENDEGNEEENEDDLILGFEKGDEFLDRLTNSTENSRDIRNHKYKCFRIFYFWLFYIFIISCFSDLYFYISYYNINKKRIYSIILFYGRIISDFLMIIPHFIFLQNIQNYNKIATNTLIGLICFLPQLSLNIISLAFIYFFEDKIFSFNDGDDIINKNEKLYLIISLFINTILNLFTSFFSVIKIIYNY